MTNPPEVPESAIKTPEGRRYWGGRVAGGKYSYWIKYGDEPNMLLHVDASGEFSSEEIDAVTDYLLWAQGHAKNKT